LGSSLLRIMSYNILAPSYAKPERYPFTERRLLAWEARRDRLAARLMTSEADVLCLQEVEPWVYQYLQVRLEPVGYQGLYAQKGQRRPEGSATFYLAERLPLVESRSFQYRDGAGDCLSGHLALIARFDLGGLPVSVINTHIRWDEPDACGLSHIGYRQVSELLEHCGSDCTAAAVVCGDFNAESDKDFIRRMVSTGFIDAYAGAPQPTANSECRAKRIDYIFHTAQFDSEPMPLPQIDDETPLPSETEPSDHLPIRATLTIRNPVRTS